MSTSQERVQIELASIWTPKIATLLVQRWMAVIGVTGVGLTELFDKSLGNLSVIIDITHMTLTLFGNERLCVMLQDVLIPKKDNNIVSDIHSVVSSDQPVVQTNWKHTLVYYTAALHEDHDTPYGYIMAAFMAQRNAVTAPSSVDNLKHIWKFLWEHTYREFLGISPILTDVFRASSTSTLGILIGKMVALISTHLSYAEINAWYREAITVPWKFELPREIDFYLFVQSIMQRTMCFVVKHTTKRKVDPDHTSSVQVRIHNPCNSKYHIDRFAIANVDKAICLFVMLFDSTARSQLNGLLEQNIVPCSFIQITATHMPFLCIHT